MSVCTTSLDILYKNLYIVVSRGPEGPQQSAPGHIRAFDAVTGEQVWIFHTIPRPGEEGFETWPENAWDQSGGANNWGGLALDEERGVVAVRTGAAAWHLYGRDRGGTVRFEASVMA